MVALGMPPVSKTESSSTPAACVTYSDDCAWAVQSNEHGMSLVSILTFFPVTVGGSKFQSDVCKGYECGTTHTLRGPNLFKLSCDSKSKRLPNIFQTAVSLKCS